MADTKDAIASDLRSLADRLDALEVAAPVVPTVIEPKPAIPATTVGDSYLFGQDLGSPIIGNVHCGGPNNRRFKFKFRADRSSGFKSLMLYYIYSTKPGYSGGTGGDLRLEIFDDSKGVVGSQRMASARVLPRLGTSQQIDHNHKVTFNQIAKPVAGHYYHLVITNVDSNSAVNFLSINNMGALNSFPDDWDGKHAYKRPHYSDNNGAWRSTKHQPTFDLEYEDGTHEGSGMFQGFAYSDQFYTTGQSMVRQRFVLPKDNVIKNINVRVARISGAGTLIARIYDIHDKLITSGSVTHTVLATQTGKLPLQHEEAKFEISGNPKLPADKEHYIRFHCTGSLSVYIYAMQDAEFYDFDKRTFGWRGHNAEISVNGGARWAGWTYSGRKNRTDATTSSWLNHGYEPVAGVLD